ncbi:hypothetical protein WT66_29420 [Burkholderia stagnalis]|nr:hypothetical protein WT18_00220 [Burkholderia stagnalis]KVP08855.1 hypothetical protein WT20_21620 [Burkholderia stagnalis]KVW88479.1 hypothetical protein WT30_32240 [Burkholderia stagnalis]KWH69017.1 hypothetical protein WT66_29420 [Burkholderia stagnalis]
MDTGTVNRERKSAILIRETVMSGVDDGDGLWGLVVINSLVFVIICAFSFLKPATTRDWRTCGGFSAFIANAGGVICAAVEYAGGSQAAALDRIAATVRENTAEVIEAATRRGQSPRDAALDPATARVRKAMSFRRWGAF